MDATKASKDKDDGLLTKENMPTLLDQVEARLLLKIINKKLTKENQIDFDFVLDIYYHTKNSSNSKDSSLSAVQIVKDMLESENRSRSPQEQIVITSEQEKEIYIKTGNYKALNEEVEGLRRAISHRPIMKDHPLPPIMVIESDTIDIFYNNGKKSDEQAKILITTELIEIFSPHEIKAMIAHEYGHALRDRLKGVNGHNINAELSSPTLTEAERKAIIEVKKGEECWADVIGGDLAGNQNMIDALESSKKLDSGDLSNRDTHPTTDKRINALQNPLLPKIHIRNFINVEFTSECGIKQQYPPPLSNKVKALVEENITSQRFDVTRDSVTTQAGLPTISVERNSPMMIK